MKCNLRQPLKYKIIDTTGTKRQREPAFTKTPQKEIDCCLCCDKDKCKGICEVIKSGKTENI